MPEGLGWLDPHTQKQTKLVMFDPKLHTNPVLLSVLERYADVEGFDNTLARVLIQNQRRKDAEPT